jgi:hypothetical protein
MATIEDAVLESFFQRIAAEPGITQTVVDELRTLLVGGTKLPTADALAQIFAQGSGDKIA